MALFGKRRSHANQISYFATLKGVVGMLRDPKGTESVFDIEDGLRGLKALEHTLEFVKRDPAVAAMIETRYLTALPDVEALDKLPDGTLGKAFARHILDHGFDPDYYRKIDVRTEIDYVLMRMRQTHDIWHVVTGIGIDPIGELAVKAFELAQTRRPLSAIITSGGVIRYLLKDPDKLGDVLSAIALGHRLGLAAKPFLAQKWEEGWRRPLNEWRKKLNVHPIEHMPVAPEEVEFMIDLGKPRSAPIDAKATDAEATDSEATEGEAPA